MKESTLTSGDNDQKTQKYILYYKLYASDARKWIARSDRYVRTLKADTHTHTLAVKENKWPAKLRSEWACAHAFHLLCKLFYTYGEREMHLVGWTMEWMDVLQVYIYTIYAICARKGVRDRAHAWPLVTQCNLSPSLFLYLSFLFNLSVYFVTCIGILHIAPGTGLILCMEYM